VTKKKRDLVGVYLVKSKVCMYQLDSKEENNRKNEREAGSERGGGVEEREMLL
jgi:hypothetical protein